MGALHAYHADALSRLEIVVELVRLAREGAHERAAGGDDELGLKQRAVARDRVEVGRVAEDLEHELVVRPDELNLHLDEGLEELGRRRSVTRDVVVEELTRGLLDRHVHLKEGPAHGDVARRRRFELHIARDELVEPTGVDLIREKVGGVDKLAHVRHV